MSHKTQTQQPQMSASITGSARAPSLGAPQAFGRIGIPAVAAAAGMMRTKKPNEKPVSASFYLGSD